MPYENSMMCQNCFQNTVYCGKCTNCGWIVREGVHNSGALMPSMILKKRYIIGRVLGAGGFGITYLAYDTTRRIRCAIKEYYPAHLVHRSEGSVDLVYSSGSSEEFCYGLEHFQKEAAILYSLQGVRSVVNVWDYFEENCTAYMVMEFVNGSTMRDDIRRRQNLPPYEKVRDIFTEECLTLQEIHQKNLLHRDISPQNIMFQPGGIITLIDFGAARFMLNERSASFSVVLKRGYAPPEQYSSHGKQGTWTDLYALAATIYYYAVAPVGETTQTVNDFIPDAMDRLNNDTLIPLEGRRTDLPIGFCRIIDKCLQISIEKRYQTAADVLEDLFIQQRRVDSKPMSKIGIWGYLPFSKHKETIKQEKKRIIPSSSSQTRREVSEKFPSQATPVMSDGPHEKKQFLYFFTTWAQYLTGERLLVIKKNNSDWIAPDWARKDGAIGLAIDTQGEVVNCTVQSPGCVAVLQKQGQVFKLTATGRQNLYFDSGTVLRQSVTYIISDNRIVLIGKTWLRTMKQ